MRKSFMKAGTVILFTCCGVLLADPISKPLSVFESTKLPRRTLSEGPSILGTFPKVNPATMTKEEKKKYQQMVAEQKRKEKENEKYRRNPALQVFESTKIPRGKHKNSVFSSIFAPIKSLLGNDSNSSSKK